MTKVPVDIKEVVRVTENHGGYLAAECVICGGSGWLHGKFGYAFYKGCMDIPSDLTHKKKCPMNEYALVCPSEKRRFARKD